MRFTVPYCQMLNRERLRATGWRLPAAGIVARFIPLFMAAGLLLPLLLPSPALAGPPYLTDDPETTDLHHWEIYNFVGGGRDQGISSLDAGVDLNYGPAPDMQLTATLPLHAETGQPLDAGDVELAVKYKFLHQRTGTVSADVALFPRVFLPTGRGSRRARLLLPLRAQRDFGPWSLIGGGGYVLNPGPGNRHYWQQGVALTRQMGPGFQLGLEYYGQGRDAIGSRPVQGMNLGAIVHIHGPFSWLASFGQGLSRRQTLFYTALKLDL